MLELDGAHDVVRRYVWGLDLSSTPEGAGGIGGLLAIDQEAVGVAGQPGHVPAGKYLPACDALGDMHVESTRQLIAWESGYAGTSGYAWSADRMVAKYEYDPYGNVTAQSGSYAAENPWRWSTKYWDAETGLGYWGYRFYDPRTGRWINRDPIEETGAIVMQQARHGGGFMPRDLVAISEHHSYAYVQNSPGMYIDSLGLQTSQPGPPSSQPDKPTFPGKGTKSDPRDLTSIYDYLNRNGDPGCGVCFRINPRGLAFSMKVKVLRVDEGCPKSKAALEKELSKFADVLKLTFWFTGFEEKCSPKTSHSAGCDCLNKQKLPKMHSKFDRTLRGVYLEYKLEKPYYKEGGCTGDFKLSALLEMDGWYGTCRTKCKGR